MLLLQVLLRTTYSICYRTSILQIKVRKYFHKHEDVTLSKGSASNGGGAGLAHLRRHRSL